MTDVVLTVVLLAALVCTALMAGLFFAFTCAVMPGLSRTDDQTFVRTMTSINAAIQNPVFGLVFVGGAVFTAAALVVSMAGGPSSAAAPAAIALGLYTAQLVVTFARNIPLNVALDREADARASAARAAFERPWVRWNLVRTLLCTASVVALGVALLDAT